MTKVEIGAYADFCDVGPCRSYVNRRFGGTCHLHLLGKKIRERGTSLNRFTQDLHNATSQNSALFTVTAAKTTDPIYTLYSKENTKLYNKTHFLHRQNCGHKSRGAV
jgi:hypothetical protein